MPTEKERFLYAFASGYAGPFENPAGNPDRSIVPFLLVDTWTTMVNSRPAAFSVPDNLPANQLRPEYLAAFMSAGSNQHTTRGNLI